MINIVKANVTNLDIFRKVSYIDYIESRDKLFYLVSEALVLAIERTLKTK